MADKCALCGQNTDLISFQSLRCGKRSEWCCRHCADLLGGFTPEYRARVLAEKGDHAACAPEERRAAAEKQLRTGWQCLRCGGEMLRRGRQQFKLGEETFFFSDINRLASGSMTLEILRCESCGKMEFYDPALFSPKDN